MSRYTGQHRGSTKNSLSASLWRQLDEVFHYSLLKYLTKDGRLLTPEEYWRVGGYYDTNVAVEGVPDPRTENVPKPVLKLRPGSVENFEENSKKKHKSDVRVVHYFGELEPVEHSSTEYQTTAYQTESYVESYVEPYAEYSTDDYQDNYPIEEIYE